MTVPEEKPKPAAIIRLGGRCNDEALKWWESNSQLILKFSIDSQVVPALVQHPAWNWNWNWNHFGGKG